MADKKVSAGILVYRITDNTLEVLLAHNGGPFFVNKDDGYWTIPKGLIEESEDGLTAAKREFKEETGQSAPNGPYVELGTVEQANNKTVYAWAVEADFDVSLMHSNTFSMEWPPRSGKKQAFPEIDRYEWFNLVVAKRKANKAQVNFIDRLAQTLDEETNAR